MYPLAHSKYSYNNRYPFDPFNSYISKGSCTNQNNNIFFKQQLPIKFEFSSENNSYSQRMNHTDNDYPSKSIWLNNFIGDQSNKENENYKPKMRCSFYTQALEKGSKTVLNNCNTWLLNLSQNNCYNCRNKRNIKISKSLSHNKASSEEARKKDTEFSEGKYDANLTSNSNFINHNFNSNFQTSNFINKTANILPFNKVVEEKPIHSSCSAFKLMTNNNIFSTPAKEPQKFYQIQPGTPLSNLSSPLPQITPLPSRELVSNITNVTNNYIFQINQNDPNSKKEDKKQISLLNKKTFRSQKAKSIKNENNDSYGLYQLNQISVKGKSISKFPVVSMNEEDLEIQLLSKMLTETEYFTIVDKYYINTPVLDEEKYNKPCYGKIFQKEKEKIKDLYLVGDNENENNPVNLIKNFYKQIKNNILEIQNNYFKKDNTNLNKISENRNKELCNQLEKLIISCNAITNTITDYKKSGLKRKAYNASIENENNNKSGSDSRKDSNTSSSNSFNKQKQKHFKTYLCEFCNKAYSNGQGLGGHMSRIHPNQSYKYKDKIRIRRERENKRENLVNIKRELFSKYGFNYDSLLDNKNKNFIQNFLHEHDEEYKNKRKGQYDVENNNKDSFKFIENSIAKARTSDQSEIKINKFINSTPIKFRLDCIKEISA